MNLSQPELSPEIISLLHQYGKKQEFKTHEILARVGEQCNTVYYVQKGGFLRRFYNEHSNILRTISFHLPTHRPFMTLNESYFAQKPSLYEIRAFRQSEVLLFSRELIDEMNAKHDFLRTFNHQWILGTLLFENEFKARLISYSSKEFYEYLCQEYPELIKEVPSKYIAEVMRISPEWLSKLRQK